MRKLAVAGFCFSVVAASGQVTALARQYERLDAAQNAGRMEEILAIAIPGARGGSQLMRLPLAQHFAQLRSVQARTQTEIVAVNLVDGEAHVRTRAETQMTVSGRTRKMQVSTQDIWVERDGQWRLKEITVTSMNEVLETVDAGTVERLGAALSTLAVPLDRRRDALLAFGKAVGDARIVSLGEASHGTREIFEWKHRLLEFLVREKGFTVFAMESNWPSSQAADRYIKTGHGDPRQALMEMERWPWQTEEVLAMLEWMREYNRSPGGHPILSFTSFDMQRWEVAAARVKAFVRQHGGPQELAAVTAAYRSLPSPAEADKVISLLTARRDAFEKAAGGPSYRDALQAARVVAQAIRNGSPAAPARYRDEMMARNVEWLANEAYPGEKIVLWAHNGHVSTDGPITASSRPMGSWLRQAFGRQLYVLGFAIHTGSVRAISTGALSNGIRAYTMPTAPPGSGTSVLSAAGKPAFFLDIAGSMAVQKGQDGSELGRWLQSYQSFREIGAVWNPEEPAKSNMLVTSLAKSYDGLIYLEMSQATKLLDQPAAN